MCDPETDADLEWLRQRLGPSNWASSEEGQAVFRRTLEGVAGEGSAAGGLGPEVRDAHAPGG